MLLQGTKKACNLEPSILRELFEPFAVKIGHLIQFTIALGAVRVRNGQAFDLPGTVFADGTCDGELLPFTLRLDKERVRSGELNSTLDQGLTPPSKFPQCQRAIGLAGRETSNQPSCTFVAHRLAPR